MAHAPDKTPRLTALESLFLKAVSVICGWVLVISTVYYFWEFPAWLAYAAPMVGACLFILVSIHNWKRLRWNLGRNELGLPFALTAVFADALLIVTLVLQRTDEGLISPWQILPAGTFVLFFIATFFLVLAMQRLSAPVRIVLGILHSFVAFSVSAIVYKLGFGYDPFVHEAATTYILQFGQILPKQPFYIGQYLPVATLSRVFGWSVSVIHAWLVPIFASILTPISIHFAWKNWTRDKSERSPLWLVWLFPFAYFTFTVPVNLAFVFLLLCVSLLPGEDKAARVTRSLAALAAIAIHPLVGIPALTLVLWCEIDRFFPARLRGVLAFLLPSVALYGALALYAYLNGGTFISPFAAEWKAVFITLFRPAFAFDPYSPWWSVLYIFYALWPWLIFFGGGYFLLRRKDHDAARRSLLGGALGILLVALVSGATLRYQNIISHEQFEFAFRLLGFLPWLALPGWLVGLEKKKIGVVSAIVISLVAVAAWHASYPQFNDIMHVHAPSVSTTDEILVDTIEEWSEGRSYAALVPQLTSAMALRKIGFTRSLSSQDGDIYPFAIPTGGYLYSRYWNLFRTDEPLPELKLAFDFSNAEILFVGIPVAWDDGYLQDRLSPYADRVELIDDSVRLYLFTSLPENP